MKLPNGRIVESYVLEDEEKFNKDFESLKEDYQLVIERRDEQTPPVITINRFILKEYMENKVKVSWENSKDELYTYFGKCECGNNCVIVGSKYCNECGKTIINPLRNNES